MKTQFGAKKLISSFIGRWILAPNGNLLALDVSSNKKAQNVSDYLGEKEQQGKLVYETGNQLGE